MANAEVVDLVKDIFAERHRLVRWLRLNASTNRNLPTAFVEDVPPPEVRVVHINEPAPSPAAAPTPQTNTDTPASVQTGTQQQPATASWPAWAKTLAVGTALLGAGGAGAGVTYLLNRPAVTPESKDDPADKTGSILQYLEDEGYHVQQ